MRPERISKAWRGVAHNPGGGAGGRGGRGGGGGLGLGLGCSATFAANRRIGTFRSQLGNFSERTLRADVEPAPYPAFATSVLLDL